MCMTKTCKSCLYCTGPVGKGKLPPLCVYTCEHTELDNAACEHHASKTGYRALIRRIANLWTVREMRPLEAGWKPEKIQTIVKQKGRIADIIHKEDYERPQAETN